MVDPSSFLRIERSDPSLRPIQERMLDYKEHEIPSSLEKKIEQAQRCMDCAVPFCMSGCPLGNPIPQFNLLAGERHWRAALNTLHSTNNFPEFTGAVCPAPCESACVLGIIKAPVAIKQLEKAIIDEGFNKGLIRPRVNAFTSGKKVAIVGAGPAGLACAQQLRRAGHDVTVFDRYSEAGGLLRFGIPAYKLPKDKVARRVAILVEEGIKFFQGVELGKDIHLEDLRREFAAVVLCIGAENPREIGLPEQDVVGVHYAMQFLGPNGQRIDVANKKVVVIGGGDTGSDCIGAAIRRKAASVVNLEIRNRPPDSRLETNPWPQYDYVYRISTSMAENFYLGGDVLYGIKTKSFVMEERRLRGLEVVGIEQRGFSHEFREVPGTERRIECDVVLLALGYLGAKVECLGKNPPRIVRGVIETNSERMSSLEGVFAAGDCRRGQSLVVWAIAEGRETAAAVDRYLGMLS